MTLCYAKTLFPEFLSTCCSATVYKAHCCECGEVTSMPFFFVSKRELPDSEAIEIERMIRGNPNVPIGCELVLRVGDHKPNL